MRTLLSKKIMMFLLMLIKKLVLRIDVYFHFLMMQFHLEFKTIKLLKKRVFNHFQLITGKMKIRTMFLN